ncbi:MAG: phospholipase [Chloroflexota bacterium]|nr:phospholipase [Chloroflexota bacterium]
MRALAQSSDCGSLDDIEHVVFLIQENRSFDHYFGAYPGVEGFGSYSAGSPVWNQAFSQSPAGIPNPLKPFRLDSNAGAACIHDVGHQWVIQHNVWNGGAMDKWVEEHITEDGTPGPLTMGYYNGDDLPFYYALADNFTICDRYHQAVISGTVANRLYTISGMLDPTGADGGPGINTPEGGNQQDYLDLYYKFTWQTIPELLRDAGISWKVYSPAGEAAVPALNDNYLYFFKNYQTDTNLIQNGLLPNYPVQFMQDCASGNLPQVSWIITSFVDSEHPPTPPGLGQDAVHTAVSAVAANPDLWRKTAMFIFWDENGGFFDHVAPPTAPAGTEGEYLSAPLPTAAGGIDGPLGLGFRVPMLIVSPFTRNPTSLPRDDPGWRPLVSSDLFDHSSTVRFLEERFGVRCPYLTDWRRETVGDLTSAFNFAGGARDPAVLPATSASADFLKQECQLAPGTEVPGAPLGIPPVPEPNPDPVQEVRLPLRPSGRVDQAACGVPAASPTPVAGGGGLPNTSFAGLGAAGVAVGAAAVAAAWWAARVRENARR